jgi:hypothetical protein
MAVKLPDIRTTGDLGDEYRNFVRSIRAENLSENTVYAYAGALDSLAQPLVRRGIAPADRDLRACTTTGTRRRRGLTGASRASIGSGVHSLTRQRKPHAAARVPHRFRSASRGRWAFERAIRGNPDPDARCPSAASRHIGRSPTSSRFSLPSPDERRPSRSGQSVRSAASFGRRHSSCVPRIVRRHARLR